MERVFLCTPDKDLAQCVVGDRVVQLDRRKNVVRGERGIWDKFGVAPASIPDYLALVGDSADGFPGLPGWGAKGTSGVLARYPHLEDIPPRAEEWTVSVRGARRLAEVLSEQMDAALLFRDLATLRTDFVVFADIDELHWKATSPDFAGMCERMNAPYLSERADRLASRRGAVSS